MTDDLNTLAMRCVCGRWKSQHYSNLSRDPKVLYCRKDCLHTFVAMPAVFSDAALHANWETVTRIIREQKLEPVDVIIEAGHAVHRWAKPDALAAGPLLEGVAQEAARIAKKHGLSSVSIDVTMFDDGTADYTVSAPVAADHQPKGESDDEHS